MTRKDNILDLFFTNDSNFIQHLDVNNVPFSDHNLIYIYTSFFSNNLCTEEIAPQGDIDTDCDFSKLNLSTTKFDAVNTEFSNVNWHKIVSGPIDDIPGKINQIVFTTLEKHTQLFNNSSSKNSKFKNRYCRLRSIVNKKIRKYKRRISSSNCSKESRDIAMNKINQLLEEKKQSFLDERLSIESRAVEKIKVNSKHFFKYANSFKKTLSTPNILQDSEGNLVLDNKDIADLLQKQFESVFSKHEDQQGTHNLLSKPNIIFPLSDLEIRDLDVVKAIDAINGSSSCPRHEIPARVLKECKYTLSKPLRMLWSTSFKSGQVPKQFKKQIIIPIFKKGSKTQAVNYRPVALSAHTIKICERIIKGNLEEYFELNSLLNSNQHGFRKQRSCATQLLTHTSFILSNLVNGLDVDCVYIDYAKAFDKVDHSILLDKLKQYGISDKYLKWIQSFLSNRSQTVYNNGVYSYSAPVLSGVPQGSVLGPLLFIIYINDLQDVIHGSEMLTFADDTKLVTRINSVKDTENLQNNLNSIINWSASNNMKLNNNKFEYINHKSPYKGTNSKLLDLLPFSNLTKTYYVSNSLEIARSSQVRDLGVIVDEGLNWKLHIDKITKQCKQLSYWILSVFHTRQKFPMLTIFNSIIRSKLEYCCQVWNPHQIQDINKIEQIQRTFTFKISGMQNYNYWERLKCLGIMSLQRRREKLIIIHIWKIFNNLLPNSTNMEFKMRARYSSNKAKVKPLPKLRGRILTLYDESFTIKAARLWNILPPELTNITSLITFKTSLDKFLQKIPDNPPISGYPHLSDNSLTNLCA